VWRQDVLDRLLKDREQLAPFGLVARLELPAREHTPGFGLERHLAPRPCHARRRSLTAASSRAELVRPGREATGAAKVIETRDHAHQCVIRSLVRNVIEIVAA
jgi:hypothetical protein